jgi:cytochrome c553
VAKIAQPVEKSDEQKEQDKLKALREKAGNIGAFKVSDAYKSKCSSCHGVNGSGYQNGRKMMGPKLFGQSEEEIYQKLSDFKAGRKENVVMKGLLIPMSDEDLRSFAKEIGEFPARAKAEREQG